MARLFTDGRTHPFDQVRWSSRTLETAPSEGGPLFAEQVVEAPETWSDAAVAAVARRYFFDRVEAPTRETSVRQLISRVVSTLLEWGREGHYLRDADTASAFADELTHLLLHQYATFSPPIWLNLGVEPHPLCAANCINSVDDSIASILELARTEDSLGGNGAGMGSNLSALPSSREASASGPAAPGPVSFVHGFGAFAGAIASKHGARQASRLLILDADHPDIEDFVTCPLEDPEVCGARHGAAEATCASSPYRDASHAVRLPDEFMRAVEEDGWWEMRAVADGSTVGRVRARKMLGLLARGAWRCGRPEIQFDTTINRANTCARSGRINASARRADYLFLDDTACTFAHLNLQRFLNDQGFFSSTAFRHAVDIVVLALEIVVDAARYPTDRIAANSHEYRPLALGYVNLGALLAARGLAYDCEEARSLAAVLTAMMTGGAYLQSARIARVLGSFPAYPLNREAMLDVLAEQRDAAHRLPDWGATGVLQSKAVAVWNEALDLGRRSGFRNSQVTVVAAAEHARLTLDCSTIGVEPWPPRSSDHGVPSPRACLQMVAAVQPFLSGAISGTITLPEDVTPEEIEELYLEAWRCGLKALKVRRDTGSSAAPTGPSEISAAERQPLPGRTRRRDPEGTVTHRFVVDGLHGCLSVGLYDDGSPAELSLTMAREASSLTTVLDAFAAAVTTSLQRGVPLESLAERFAEPADWTLNPHIPRAARVMEHVLSWLVERFPAG